MKVVVQEWERVLVYRDGRFETELASGRHRVRSWHRRTVRIAVRPRLVVVPLQEVLTSDGLAVRISLAVRVRMSDARRWHEAVDAPDAFVHVAVQVALRDAVGSRTLDEVLADRSGIAEQVASAAGPAAAEVGLAVQQLALRDVVVPAELRRAAAELATTRAQGLAALERARSEVAAMRALANAARMAEQQPALLQLRTLQAVEAGGATVVLKAG